MDEIERDALALTMRMLIELLELKVEGLPQDHHSRSLMRKLVDRSLDAAERLEAK